MGLLSIRSCLYGPHASLCCNEARERERERVLQRERESERERKKESITLNSALAILNKTEQNRKEHLWRTAQRGGRGCADVLITIRTIVKCCMRRLTLRIFKLVG
jgi:hypothetical protein